MSSIFFLNVLKSKLCSLGGGGWSDVCIRHCAYTPVGLLYYHLPISKVILPNYHIICMDSAPYGPTCTNIYKENKYNYSMLTHHMMTLGILTTSYPSPINNT